MAETVEDIRLREKFTAVIEFCKVSITLATAVLTGFAALFLFSGSSNQLNLPTILCAALAILSVVAALVGFGQSAGAIGSGKPSNAAILGANISPILLLLAIIVGVYAARENSRSLSIAEVLAKVTTESKGLPVQLTMQNFRSLHRQDGDYVLEYNVGGRAIVVTVEATGGEIRSLR